MSNESEDGVEFASGGEVLVLSELHEAHPGYTQVLHDSYCESARVCLGQFHASPTDIIVEVHDETHNDQLIWEATDQQTRNAQANLSDAACNGAYAISILCVERKFRFVAVGRAEELTGADWYIAPPGLGVDELGAPDLDCEDVLRLEVSGTVTGPTGARVTKKKKQLKDGQSSIPGIASIVGFKRPIVIITSQD